MLDLWEKVALAAAVHGVLGLWYWSARRKLSAERRSVVSEPRRFVSERGVAQGAPREPLVFFGHLGGESGVALANMISTHSTIDCLLVPDLESLRAWLAGNEAAALVAHSRAEAPGEAALAIQAFHELQPTGRPALYHAWDYHVGRAAARALACGADGVVMPAIDLSEFFGLVFGVMARASAGAPPPETAKEHEALLRQFAPNSPFWGLADTVESPYY